MGEKQKHNKGHEKNGTYDSDQRHFYCNYKVYNLELSSVKPSLTPSLTYEAHSSISYTFSE